MQRTVPIFQVDAFTSRRFAGNPAAVVLLPDYLPDDVLQAVAAENNLAETAFLVRDGHEFRLRWFTPVVEVPLCGHATLASAAVVLERLEPGRDSVVFTSASGPLTVRRRGTGYVLDFPGRPCRRVPAPAGMADALGVEPVEVHENEFNYLAVLDDERAVRGLAPDFAAVARLDRPGVIVTAAGDGRRFDIVSRYFAPRKGIPEDPVTGAAHCTLAPYWSPRLGRDTLHAFQASPRGGELECRLRGDRVDLAGDAVFYLEGQITL